MDGYYRRQDRHLIAVDNIIFGFDGEKLNVLILKRHFEPLLGNWCLVGEFVKENESLDHAANRVVEELTGLKGLFMEQFFTYGTPERDPAARTISVAYYTLIRSDDYHQELGRQKGAAWFPVEEVPALVFDHNHMIRQALKVLRQKTRTQPIGFHLLPEKFTLPQLRSLYEAIHGQTIDHGNFSKKLHSMQLLTRLEEKDKSQSKKGAFYYRFEENRYQTLLEQGFLFDLKVKQSVQKNHL
ncbi:MAG: NUDIX domain-containing protein [Bacteroidota bacterium]